MTRSELPFDSAVATGKGDDGTTGLLFGGPRIRKDDLRTEAYGTVDETEVKMILTTPFCPYAGAMIAQVKEQAESVVDHPVKVTLLAERWDPRDAGLMW